MIQQLRISFSTIHSIHSGDVQNSTNGSVFGDIQHRKYIEQASVYACTLRDFSDMNMRSIADLLEKIGPKSVQPSRGKGLNQPGHAVVL